MANSPKNKCRRVDGVLLLDKPEGLSSNAALQQARRIFAAPRGGHTGTLDPLASGLLPLCFGEATKFSGDLLDADKCYQAGLQLGVCTSTGDREGVVTTRAPVRVELARVQACLTRFVGECWQTPPMYSALKHGGKPLYQLARQGVEVKRPPRRVFIRRIELLSLEKDSLGNPPHDQLHILVHCSKGTYIRVLAEEIGEQLGCGAHLSSLRRIAVGHLNLEHAYTLRSLEAMSGPELEGLLLSVDTLLSGLPALTLDEPEASRFCHGNAQLAGDARSGPYRVYSVPDRFIGTGEVRGDGQVHPKRLLAESRPNNYSLS